QLDRALPSEGKDYRFESCRGYLRTSQINPAGPFHQPSSSGSSVPNDQPQAEHSSASSGIGSPQARQDARPSSSSSSSAAEPPPVIQGFLRSTSNAASACERGTWSLMYPSAFPRNQSFVTRLASAIKA